MKTQETETPVTGRHTPGPWKATCEDVTGDRPLGDDGRRFWTIEPLNGEYRGNVAHVHLAEHINGITADERDANARLIAAAPELLEALKVAVSLCSVPERNQDREWEQQLEDCIKVVAKAEGRQ